MAYSDPANVRILLGSPTEEDLATSVVTLMQRRADAYIDGCLRHLYPVPFTAPAPAQVVTWSETLTAFQILKMPIFRQRFVVDTAMVDQERNLAVQELMAAAQRKIRLVGVDPWDRTVSTTSTYNKTFSILDSKYWFVDPGQQTDELAKRGLPNPLDSTTGPGTGYQG